MLAFSPYSWRWYKQMCTVSHFKTCNYKQNDSIVNCCLYDVKLVGPHTEDWFDRLISDFCLMYISLTANFEDDMHVKEVDSKKDSNQQ